MSNRNMNVHQGHWLLHKMGKRVLRPGGKELSLKMLDALEIGVQDRVVEFAPGIGFTAGLVLKKHPASYTGVELNEEAATNLRKKIHGVGRSIVVSDASSVDLPGGVADKLYGEAMLTMHVDKRKSAIIREAYRLLRKGGLYAIHELGLLPDSLEPSLKATIQRDLALCIQVNARPLTQAEWVGLLEQEGFRVRKVFTNPMNLLEARRVIDDEGFLRSLRIGLNILKHPAARARILEMRRIFRKYAAQMNAVALVAEK